MFMTLSPSLSPCSPCEEVVSSLKGEVMFNVTLLAAFFVVFPLMSIYLLCRKTCGRWIVIDYLFEEIVNLPLVVFVHPLDLIVEV